MILDELIREAECAGRRQAARDGVSFGLDLGGIRARWIAQHGRCALTGVVFSDERVDDAPLTYPFAPSLLLISPERGYVTDNVRLATRIAVFLRERWGEAVVTRLLEASPADITDAQMSDHDFARQGRASAVIDSLRIPTFGSLSGPVNWRCRLRTLREALSCRARRALSSR